MSNKTCSRMLRRWLVSTSRPLTRPRRSLYAKLRMEEVEPRDWGEKVYKPDIVNKPEQLYKRPGYDPSDLP